MRGRWLNGKGVVFGFSCFVFRVWGSNPFPSMKHQKPTFPVKTGIYDQQRKSGGVAGTRGKSAKNEGQNGVWCMVFGVWGCVALGCPSILSQEQRAPNTKH